MKTYNERLLAIAEEMATTYHGETWLKVSNEQRKEWVSDWLSYAAIALKHMAEAYAEGCGTILLDKDEIQRNLFLIGYEPQTT